MSSCCSSILGDSAPKKRPCPQCGSNGALVSSNTIYHHLKQSWQWQAKEQAYYFCDDPNCNVAYFGEDDSVIEQSVLRMAIAVKTQVDDDLICYCYGVSLGDAKADSSIKDFVIKMTKNSACACESRNPSGRCCLKDF